MDFSKLHFLSSKSNFQRSKFLNVTELSDLLPELPRTLVLTVSWKMITAGVKSPTPLLHRLAVASNSSEKCFV